MKKLLLVAASAALTLTACGGGGSVAATVNGEEITVADVEGVPFASDGTMEPGEFTQYLSALVQWNIIEDAAASEFGIEPTEDEVTAELEEVLAQIAPDQTMEQVAEAQNLSTDTLRTFAENGLIQQQVAGELAADMESPSEEEIEAARVEELANLTEVCARHILVATNEEAVAAKERLEGGEDFAEVAAEVSTDPSAATNGGDLDCAPAGQYVPEFRDAAVAAAIDEISDPVESQFGFHLIQVYDRTEAEESDLPSDEELSERLVQEAGSASLQTWLVEKATAAEVTVDEEYGTWSLEPQPGIQPPTS